MPAPKKPLAPKPEARSVEEIVADRLAQFACRILVGLDFCLEGVADETIALSGQMVERTLDQMRRESYSGGVLEDQMHPALKAARRRIEAGA